LSFRLSVSKKAKPFGTIFDMQGFGDVGGGEGEGGGGGGEVGEGREEGGGRVTSDILNPINPTQQNIFSKSEHFHFLPSAFTVSSAFCKLIFFLPQKQRSANKVISLRTC
jgi:hypothetical protein